MRISDWSSDVCSSDLIQRHPILAPAPGVELRMLRGTQADVGVAANQAQQEPDLFLTLIVPAPFAPDKMIRYVITQPVACAPQNADMFGLKAHFFVEFAIHGLHRALDRKSTL